MNGLQKLYSDLHPTYELVNHVLTFGLDVSWRKRAGQIAARKGGSCWLDACSGTGEMAKELSTRADAGALVVAADFTAAMLAHKRPELTERGVSPVVADSARLPFPNDLFDLVTVAFATRNLKPSRAILIDYLREFRRILRPGGCFLNLETSQPRSLFIRLLFHAYVKIAVRPVGALLSGSKAGYRFLAYTIPRFYGADDFSLIIKEAGFTSVVSRPLFFGVAAIHTAAKGKAGWTTPKAPSLQPGTIRT